MSRYTIEQLRQEHPNLDSYILSLREVNEKILKDNTELKNRIKEYEKFSVRTNPPTSTYRELEEKVKNLEQDKQKDIDELFTTRIIPLNKQIVELRQELTSANNINQEQKNRIKDLEIVRDNLNIMINFAVGYISATQPHTDKHPMEVKQWLFKGLQEIR